MTDTVWEPGRGLAGSGERLGMGAINIMVNSSLLANLGLEDGPAVHASWEDADAAARLVRTLVEIRNERGLTQAQVAQAMGTTQSAVSDLERTAGDPRISTVQRFGRAVGVKVCFTVTTPRSAYVSKSQLAARRVRTDSPLARDNSWRSRSGARAS